MLDFLPDKDTLEIWFHHYGSAGLFILLALGIVALPIPDETLLVLSGVFIGHGKLELIPTLFAAYGGSLCGITLSYIIGRVSGALVLEKFGGYIGLDQQKMDKAHYWFKKYGKWTLLFGYFIPGVRHVISILAGVSLLEYPIFALFAYTGGILWVSTFLAIGYFFGEHGLGLFA